MPWISPICSFSRRRDNATDREILESLTGKDHREAFAARIHGSNKSTYVYKAIIWKR